MEEPIDVDLPKSLRATRLGRIAHLRLARAEKRNALDDKTVLGLEAFFTRLPRTFAGRPDRRRGALSAGLDLSEVAEEHEPLEGVLHSRSGTARSRRSSSGAAGHRGAARRGGRRRAGAGRRDPYPRRRALGLLRPAGGAARHLPRRRRISADRAADRRRAHAWT